AKCVKYGGMSEREALATITINGAKQLGLDKRTGSIEVGKDADLAIFNGHPLNSYSRVEATLVEGEIYFQRAEHLKAVAVAAEAPAKPRTALETIKSSAIGRYALVNVTVHPASGPVIANGGVVIDNGKIVHVLSNADMKGLRASEKTTVIDASGL